MERCGIIYYMCYQIFYRLETPISWSINISILLTVWSIRLMNKLLGVIRWYFGTSVALWQSTLAVTEGPDNQYKVSREGRNQMISASRSSRSRTQIIQCLMSLPEVYLLQNKQTLPTENCAVPLWGFCAWCEQNIHWRRHVVRQRKITGVGQKVRANTVLFFSKNSNLSLISTSNSICIIQLWAWEEKWKKEELTAG